MIILCKELLQETENEQDVKTAATARSSGNYGRALTVEQHGTKCYIPGVRGRGGCVRDRTLVM